MMQTQSLEVTTPSDREIVMTRSFDAPRHLVFDAWTKPDLMRRWLLGPDGWSMTVCDVDLRVGGAYHFVWRNEEGFEFGLGGTYREVARPERLANTEQFEGVNMGGESLSTLVLTEANGRTTVTNTVLYGSREERDGALASGMADGVAASYDRLDGVLASAA